MKYVSRYSYFVSRKILDGTVITSLAALHDDHRDVGGRESLDEYRDIFGRKCQEHIFQHVLEIENVTYGC